MKRNNDIYVYAMMFVFLLGFFWCPVMYAFDRLDVIHIENPQSHKDPGEAREKDEFPSGFLGAVERGKAGLYDMYTYYLPFYGVPRSKPDNAEIGEIIEETTKEPIPDATVPEKVPVKVEATLLHDDNFHRYYAFEPYKFLDRWIIGTDKSLRKKFDRQLDNINRIIASEPDINFYVYVLTRMQDTEYAIDLVPDEFSTIDFFYEFISGIRGAKGVGSFDIDTVEKRVERVFLTDHHWAAAGAYSGYVDCVNMMKKITPEIGEPLPTNGKTGLIRFDDVKMRGSFAATLRYEEYYEPFLVLDITLPAFTDPGVHIDAYDRYSAGKFDKGTFTDHYSAYYNSSGQRHYSVKGNDTKRNLLVIGDSYSWWFNWLIAANFDNVYIFLPPWDQKIFQYHQFIADNGITDVLLTQFSDRLMFDYYSDSDMARIKTD